MGDTTIRLRLETKERLNDLDIAKKNTSYNEIIEKLINEYELKFKNA